MTDKTYKEVEENLILALKKMEDNQEKVNKKYWKEITFPVTLEKALGNYTKDDLTNIRKFLNIKNASNLNKAELIALLGERIPGFLEEICLKWDKDRFQLLEKLTRHDFISAPDWEPDQFNYLRSSGFLFTGTHNSKKIIVIPAELLEQIKALVADPQVKATIQRNTDWVKLTHGLLYYYGTVRIDQLVKLLESYTEETIDMVEYMEVIRGAIDFHDQVSMDSHGLSYWRVEDPARVIQEQQMRKSVSFYPFTKQQLLRASVTDFVEKNKHSSELTKYIMENFEVELGEAEAIVEDCIDAMQEGQEPNEIMHSVNNLFEFNSIEDMQSLMDRLFKLMNNTRQWVLKGHSSEQLRAVEKKHLRPIPEREFNTTPTNSKAKVGRNDPCPCGSGKKYKKCCLN